MMKQDTLEKIKNTILFKGISPEDLDNIFRQISYRIQKYEKGETLFLEEEECDSIGIVLQGEIELYKGIHAGKRVTLTRIFSGDMFAEAIIFSTAKKYPATIEAMKKTDILYISRTSLMGMYLMFPSLIESFINILSNKIIILNEKINLLSLKNIRQKIAYMILKQGTKSENGDLIFQLTKQKFSEQIGVERPSLSRELIKMKEEGIFEIDGKKIKVRDENLLLHLLQN